MATRKTQQIESLPKKTLQGLGKHTKYAATSRNKARKRYRGQGKAWLMMTHKVLVKIKLN